MAELLKVDLNVKPINDVLQWIAMNRLSCVATVKLENDNEINLCMEEGKIVFVSSRSDGYRLGEYLVKTGVLSEAVVSVALEESRNSGVSFTRHLIEWSIIPVDELGLALEQLVEKILIEVFVSRNGSVSVTSPLPEIIMNSPIRLDTGRVISDALRIFDEMNRGIR
jgi:hypothetical protein